MIIRPVVDRDRSEWMRMRQALWPDCDDLAIGPEPNAVFVAERESGGLGGFAEVSTRPYADRCDTSPVGYLEGWYVDPDLRRSGVGRALVEAAEKWAIEQGYTEMGSDCLIDNDISLRAHLALGYQEKERIICFCKRLSR